LYDYQLASSAKDLVFLVIPGGGYSGVAINHEGHDVAARLNDQGYSAYVLSYRLPTVRSEEHTSELQSRENLVCRLLLEKKIHTTGRGSAGVDPAGIGDYEALRGSAKVDAAGGTAAGVVAAS